MKLWRWLWLGVTLGVLVEGFRVALFVVPADSAQGNVQRIFYYHIPSWAGMGLFFAINLGCSLVYLAVRNRNEGLAIKADSLAVASAEGGGVFCFIGLGAGSLSGCAGGAEPEGGSRDQGGCAGGCVGGDGRGVLLHRAGNRVAVGTRGVGHLVDVGCTADVDAGAVADLCRVFIVATL